MFKSAQPEKKPTVFILYIPGGAMLGLIPALTLSHIESLTETPTSELFQVIEGVSTGSILAAGFNMPGRNAKKVAELFVRHGPEFFPDMPGRWTKMHVRNGINIIKYFADLDPKQADFLSIDLIRQMCAKMHKENTVVSPHLIADYQREATSRWLTGKRQKRIQDLGDDIVAHDPAFKDYIDSISELVANRTFTSALGVIFKSAVVGTMDIIKNRYSQQEDCYFSSEVPEQIFKGLYGDRKISGSICSTYISAYDIIENRIVTFSCLKDDLFDKEPGASATIQNDIKFWDAAMGSSANELAFKSHITETNILCGDKAILHKPRSVNDVLAKVEPGTRVVLVVAGTGDRNSNDLIKFLEFNQFEDDSLTEEEKYRKKLEIIRDRRAELGVAGNLALGQELSELEGYTTSDWMDDFAQKLGEDNIINLTPRISPQTPHEKREFPSRDVLDASKENIQKIIKRGRKYCKEEDEQIRKLAQMLVDNLYMIGKMDQKKYLRVSARIGIHSATSEAAIDKETEGIEDKIASNDNSTGIKKVWRKINRHIFKSKAGGPLPAENEDDLPADENDDGPSNDNGPSNPKPF